MTNFEYFEQLINSTNASTSKGEVAKAFYDAMVTNHRTLQQSFMRELVEGLKMYAEADSDGRNEGAVNFAKQVKELDPYLPFI